MICKHLLHVFSNWKSSLHCSKSDIIVILTVSLPPDEQLIRIVKDFFMAGSETTSTTIQWACLFFLERPDVQVRMRKEIEEVVGTNRRPGLADRQHLHYCEAVISEIQRCSNISPLTGLHTASQDVEWNGYVIPKDATIVFNLDSIQYDPEVFPEPRKFKPERFLTEDGKYTGNKNTMMVFGHGKYRSFLYHCSSCKISNRPIKVNWPVSLTIYQALGYKGILNKCWSIKFHNRSSLSRE